MRIFFSIAISCLFFFGCTNNDLPVSNQAITYTANQHAEFAVNGMMCEHGCKAYLSDEISKFSGVADCEILFEQEKLVVNYDKNILTANEIVFLVADLKDGQYSLEVLENNPSSNADSEQNLSSSQEDEISVSDFGFSIPNLSHLFTNWL